MANNVYAVCFVFNMQNNYSCFYKNLKQWAHSYNLHDRFSFIELCNIGIDKMQMLGNAFGQRIHTRVSNCS